MIFLSLFLKLESLNKTKVFADLFAVTRFSIKLTDNISQILSLIEFLFDINLYFLVNF